MVAQGIPCLGPITHDGCGAICPAYDRGCYGCYGPAETVNAASLGSCAGLQGRPASRASHFQRQWHLEFRARAGQSESSMKTIKVDYLARVEGEGALTIG